MRVILIPLAAHLPDPGKLEFVRGWEPINTMLKVSCTAFPIALWKPGNLFGLSSLGTSQGGLVICPTLGSLWDDVHLFIQIFLPISGWLLETFREALIGLELRRSRI